MPLVFENLSAGDVIPVIVAVNHILHRLVGNLGDLFAHDAGMFDAHRVGGDNTFIGDNENAAGAPVAEGIEPVVDFRGVMARQHKPVPGRAGRRFHHLVNARSTFFGKSRHSE